MKYIQFIVIIPEVNLHVFHGIDMEKYILVKYITVIQEI